MLCIVRDPGVVIVSVNVVCEVTVNIVHAVRLFGADVVVLLGFLLWIIMRMMVLLLRLQSVCCRWQQC